MTLNPVNVDTIIPGDFLRCLFIGENGSGKSLAAASFPEPILYLDFDKRMLPVRMKFPHRNIKFITVTLKNFSDFRDFVENLQGYCNYKTIVLDSFTAFTTLAVVYQMLLRGHSNASEKMTKGGVEIPSWDEFNGETMLGTTVVEVLKNVKANIIVSAHPLPKTEIVNGKSVRSRVITSYGNKIAAMLPNYFDEIYNFSVQPAIDVKMKPKHIVTTVHTGTDMAKTSYQLPPEIDITDRYDFYDIIQGYITKELSNEKPVDKTNQPIASNPIVVK